MAVRYTLQAELFGLTPAQRTQAVNTVTAAITGEQVNVSGSWVAREQTMRGTMMVIVEVNEFTARAAGDRIFDACVSWARTRATGASYVWIKEVDDIAGTIQTRRAAAPGWTDENTTEPLRIAR